MPNTITDTLQELADNKSDIQDALVAKGVTLAAGHGFNKFAEDIGTITNQYTQADEGKVVNDGALVAQTSTNITSNGTVDTTTNNEVIVAVPNTYSVSDEGKVVSSGALVSQTSTSFDDNGTYNTTTNNSVTVSVPLTTKSITSNGTYSASSDSVKGYTQVSVAVPNTYAAGDEGKVVSNGALVAQTAYHKTITENGTYSTTENNSITVNIPSSAEVIPLTTTFGDIEQTEAYIVKTSTNIYIYGLIYVNNISGQYIIDIVFNYDSNIDVSGLNGKRYSFNGVGSGYNYYGTLIVNQNNKTITFNFDSYYLLQTGSYVIHPSSFSSN